MRRVFTVIRAVHGIRGQDEAYGKWPKNWIARTMGRNAFCCDKVTTLGRRGKGERRKKKAKRWASRSLFGPKGKKMRGHNLTVNQKGKITRNPPSVQSRNEEVPPQRPTRAKRGTRRYQG